MVVHEVVQPRNLLLKDRAVKKEERAERLVLRRCGDLSVDGQRRQEARDLCRTHGGGMALSVEEDVAADPRDVRLLGATAIVPGSNGIAHAIEKPRARGALGSGFAHGPGGVGNIVSHRGVHEGCARRDRSHASVTRCQER
jgi:hypothetical protein